MELFKNLAFFNIGSFLIDSLEPLNIAVKLCGNVLLIVLFYYQIKKHQKDDTSKNNNGNNKRN